MLRTLLLIAIGSAASISFADEKPMVRIVGHRGEPKAHPENTLPAFEACIRAGAGFELDVRRTKDGHLVVLHDDTVDRTTNGTGKIADISLAELKKLDAGRKFDSRFTGKTVPEVGEVFSQFGKHVSSQRLICVDLKINDEKVADEVIQLAKRNGVFDHLLFIGTAIDKPEVRERIRAADAKAHVACLADKPEGLAAALQDKTSDWAYVRFIPTGEHMNAIRAAGKKVIIVGPLVMGKEPDNWKRGIDAGVDALLTDYPREARQLLVSKEAPKGN